jgi:hypothetical protein
MNKSIFKLPSAILPIMMSLAALTLVLVHVALRGGTPEPPDEGTAAHVFQLLLAGQAPIVAFFAIRWLPRLPAETLMMIGIQAGAAMLALAPVVILDL